MQNLQQDLIKLLENEDNLVVDNQLNKNKIIEWISLDSIVYSLPVSEI